MLSGLKISFGSLGSTRIACPEAVGTQEGKYLKVLEEAERFTVDGSTLLIYSKVWTNRCALFARSRREGVWV